MPYRDGTGPAGAGPMTGRGLGLCGGARPAGWGMGFGGGRGFGPGRGFGRGMGFGRGLGWFAAGYGQAGADFNKAALEERKAFLQAELDRMDDLIRNAPGGSRTPEGNSEKA